MSHDQKRALALYDNRTGELATWNVEQLVADLDAGLSLQPFWSAEEKALLLHPGVKFGKTDPDKVPGAGPSATATGLAKA